MIHIKLKNYMHYNFKELTNNLVDLKSANDIIRELNIEFFF